MAKTMKNITRELAAKAFIYNMLINLQMIEQEREWEGCKTRTHERRNSHENLNRVHKAKIF